VVGAFPVLSTDGVIVEPLLVFVVAGCGVVVREDRDERDGLMVW
jgi:hypothetical protein